MARIEPVWAMGLMSGTSMDGVDAALVLTDGVQIKAFGPSLYHPYTAQDRAVLRAGMDMAARSFATRAGAAPPDAHAVATAFAAVDDVIARTHRTAATELSRQRPGDIRVLGVHGQTLFHRPQDGISIQRPRVFDKRLRLLDLPHDCVTDFRSADVRSGGEGAPLAPFFHWACAKWAGLTGPSAFLNLGGVGNVTVVDQNCATAETTGAVVACDTGPANAPLNDLMQARLGVSYDKDGACAAQGSVHPSIIADILTRSFFDRPAPKSLDRDAFADVASRVANLTTEDAAATLTALPAACVGAQVRHFTQAPTRWFVSGGGAKNPVMMAALQSHLDAPVEPVETLGLDGDMLEAQAFAYLAVRARAGLPLSAPGTTGVKKPVTGGTVIRF